MNHYLFKALALISISILTACSSVNDQENNNAIAAEDNKTFKPGIGFFMGRMQVYHEKLGHSITEENVELINFYIHELEENIEDTDKTHPGRTETKLLNTLITPIEEMEDALDKKDFAAVKEGYLQLTKSCNACHDAVGFSFISIKVPTENSFPTQDFRKK